MINCPKCGADNQIGAIFCRGCGDKLELDELKPDSVKDAAIKAAGNKEGRSIFRLVKNIIMLIILVCLLGALAMLYLAPATPNVPDPDEKQVQEIEKKYQRFVNGRRKRVLTLTHQEANYMIQNVMGITEAELEEDKKQRLESGESGLRMTALWAEVIQPDGEESENLVRLVLKEEHTSQGFIRFYRTIVGTVYAKEKGGLGFKVKKAYMGRMPMHVWGDFTTKNVISHFETALQGKQPANKMIDSRTAKVKITDEEIKLYRR